MQDHLRLAALAAAMSDDELAASHALIVDPDNLTAEQQAVIDEIMRRSFKSNIAGQSVNGA